MSTRIFGTDGVRGIANRELTADLVLKVGRALGLFLKQNQEDPLVLVGKDPRLSSDMIEASFSGGVLSSGTRVGLVGIVPTPALSLLVQEYAAQAAVMISASHNPIEDNGIKIFGANGMKLTDDEEDRIEEFYRGLAYVGPRFPAALARFDLAPGRYLAFLRHQAPTKLTGLHIVLDCAWGATSPFAPALYEELGFQVTALNALPDGSRVNVDCGATHPQLLAETVLRCHADLGFSFDGDGDRLMACDRLGRILDGDRLLRAKVGDRYVLEQMLESGAVVGGEQSGHIIFLEMAHAGDGILSSLVLLRLMEETNLDLSELGQELVRVPQFLLNVPVERKELLFEDPAIAEAIFLAEERLKGHGRVLVRPSGTEKLVRVMVEALDTSEAEAAAKELAELICGRLH
ncbi:MAG: phosphoglucosamine mutase [Coprothermobacterota bacterium]|nr:phosphoglucosamine mutase [Coprothermobacterota bacterium]